MRKSFTQLVAEAEARPEQEWFHFGNLRWDVAKAWRWIDAGVVNYDKENADIVGYAEGVMSLNRDENRIGHSFFVRLDADYIRSMQPDSEQYNSPGLLLANMKEFDGASIVIDGNHRLAAHYMNGVDQMEMYVLDGNLSKALQSSAPTPPKALRRK